MIINKEYAKNLTDAQWLTLMKLAGDKEMILTFPDYEGAITYLVQDGWDYTIHANGTYTARRIVN